MKRILAILMAVVMVFAVCALTGCGDKKNTDPTTATTASKVEATEKVDPKQTAYEELFNDLTKVELNAKNMTASMSSNGVKVMELQTNEAGDSKAIMYLSETLGYTTYTIGKDSYIEMHIPEYKDEKGKTVKAEDVYYKTKNEASLETTDFSINNIVESLQLSKENIKSVKYVETKDIEGVNCDVVEVVHNVTTNDGTIAQEELENSVNAAVENTKESEPSDKTANDSEKNVENTENTENPSESTDTIGAVEDPTTAAETVEMTTTFYFTTDGNKLFGFSSDNKGAPTVCYFPTELTIELPKDVKFVDADDEKVSKKMMALYTAMSSQADMVGETTTENPTQTNN